MWCARFLTGNDNRPELKKFLNGVVPHFRPVETTALFMQRFRALKPLLWGNKSVFGHITDHWSSRIGGLHIHMLLWVDNYESKEGKVLAVVPREVDDVKLREMVLKYQMHSYRSGHCFKKDAKHTLCKYGFPYALLKEDGLDESGIRDNYARIESEDAKVVLKTWDGYIKVQTVTQLGLVTYLVKYVSKIVTVSDKTQHMGSARYSGNARF